MVPRVRHLPNRRTSEATHVNPAHERIAQIVENDPHAPHYHFIAPEGKALPFDPNGAIWWNHRYHLFYIFQDANLPNGGHCWGHASSADLLHWDFHPVALSSPEGDSDRGIFSGNAFVSKDGIPTISYFGVDSGICLAQSTDDNLDTWTKLPQNPVIPVPKEGDPGFGVYNVFDPHVWLEGDTYYAILGGMVKPDEVRDTVYLFQSRDMLNWEYLHPFYEPRPEWTGEEEDCACPDFFEIGGRHALLCISHPRGTRCYLGRYEDKRFIPESHHRMNFPGGSCFAPESLLDGTGRRVFWGWVIDQRKGEWVVANELGVMTMPRVLLLDESGQPLIDPPVELEQLRRNHRRVSGSDTAAIRGDVLELAVDADLPGGSALEVGVRVSADGSERTIIRVDRANDTLSIDTTSSSLADNISRIFPIIRADGTDTPVQIAPFELEEGERLSLRVFIDKSIVEVYANRRQCVTGRIYPTREDSAGVTLGCVNGAVVRSVNAWEMERTQPGGA